MQKSAAVPAPASPTLTLQSLAPYVLWTLLAAGLGEMFLYRMLSRVGVHIPKEGLVLDAYDALVRLGSFAFNVSSGMVFAALSFLLSFVNEGDSAKLTYGSLSAGIMLLLATLAWTDGQSDAPRKVI